MHQATTARAFLRRLHPWVGKAVHPRWAMRRSLYQSELNEILMALHRKSGRVAPELSLRIQGLLAKLYREWFPRTWRKDPTYAEIIADFRWWLAMAERWGQPAPRPRTPRPSREPIVDQPPRLLRILGLPRECTEVQFQTTWRSFLKRHHPDLNPDQTPEERRYFAEAVGLWRR